MCRFLVVKSRIKFNAVSLLQEFARMAKNSKALDGDWQGDGWGVSWIDKQNIWQSYTSLLPVWDDMEKYSFIPETTTIAVHARSASFPQHKGILEFNQPYISGKYAFVFNGLIRGVSLPDTPGSIGAEKIWFLVKQNLKSQQPQQALDTVRDLIWKNSREVVALNMGLASPDNIFFVNYFAKNPEYYQLHYYNQGDVQAFCSEFINWTTIFVRI